MHNISFMFLLGVFIMIIWQAEHNAADGEVHVRRCPPRHTRMRIVINHNIGDGLLIRRKRCGGYDDGGGSIRDYCSPDPCGHGRCTNLGSGYRCSCINGWTGTNCNNDINECSSNPCDHGTCTNLRGTYDCSCHSGWTGTDCGTDINECSSNPCDHGTCTNQPGTYDCSCHSGWTGTDCGTDVNECSSNPCDHGTCINLPGTYDCVCYSGWSGDDCGTDVNECSSNPCDHGTCTNQPGTYDCVCYSGWSGTDCNIDINECSSNPCDHGTCTNQPGTYECDCYSGWTGTDCGTDINECSSNPCDHGTCTNQPGTYECACHSGWTGTDCGTVLLEDIHDTTSTGSTEETKTKDLHQEGFISGGAHIHVPFIHTSDETPTVYIVTSTNTNTILCTNIQIVPTGLLCQTRALEDLSLLDVQCDIVVVFGNNNTSSSSRLPHTFTYRADPAIKQLYPLESIIKGGTLLTVEGNDLLPLKTPMLLTRVFNKVQQLIASFSTSCSVKSNDQLTCTTPSLSHLVKRHQTRERRDATYQIDDLHIYIGITLDTISKYEDLSSTHLSQYSQLTYVYEPNIEAMSDRPLIVKTWWPNSVSKVSIQGDYSTVSSLWSQLQVTVGNVTCDVTQVLDTVVTFLPPGREPSSEGTQQQQEGTHEVVVTLGLFHASAGYLHYESSITDCSLCAAMLFLSLGMVVLGSILVFFLWRRRARRQQSVPQNSSKKAQTEKSGINKKKGNFAHTNVNGNPKLGDNSPELSSPCEYVDVDVNHQSSKFNMQHFSTHKQVVSVESHEHYVNENFEHLRRQTQDATVHFAYKMSKASMSNMECAVYADADDKAQQQTIRDDIGGINSDMADQELYSYVYDELSDATKDGEKRTTIMPPQIERCNNLSDI